LAIIIFYEFNFRKQEAGSRKQEAGSKFLKIKGKKS